MPAKKVHLLVGTYKGAFILTADRSRKRWKTSGPFLKGSEVNHIMMDTRGEPVICAASNSSWFGPGFKFSRNLGKTWEESEKGIRFEENAGKKVERVWALAAGPVDQPKVIYAGVDPGALFKTEDGGKTWEDVKGLTNHPTRERWTPGAGGLMVHSICLHPRDAKRMYVGISAAGTFFTQDGGNTWEPRNKGVLAEFLPDKYPEVGQCVHHLEAHPAKPDVLYQQNHCGAYRSDNGGKEWTDINKGLPSRFGFPLILSIRMTLIPCTSFRRKGRSSGAHRKGNSGSTEVRIGGAPGKN